MDFTVDREINGETEKNPGVFHKKEHSNGFLEITIHLKEAVNGRFL